ncbi:MULTISPECIES: hypothetical protein [Kluyvera]|uniref:Uncharacterized protein n=1 Tax=Kluyvera genomosp. 3 TaxID=2774055 RepID=A0A6G9RLC2_9ENTR|nr:MULTISPECIES: hypothetical protein [Kluyvera]MDA8488658.1 hypothetical protein [Kluyvera sp. Awk 3]QIR27710.1 hypothetical protein GY169_13255 [Kluyvera genomosp. 3]
MSELSIQETHEQSLEVTRQVLQSFGWFGISVGVLSDAEKRRLQNGIETSVLNWPWAMAHYGGSADEGILDITLKVSDHAEPDGLHAVIICRFDPRRDEFAICMLENLINDQTTVLTGNVLTIALVYATTFCDMREIEDVGIQDPSDEAKPRYRSYGFAEDFTRLNRMSSTVVDVKQRIKSKVQAMENTFDE